MNWRVKLPITLNEQTRGSRSRKEIMQVLHAHGSAAC